MSSSDQIPEKPDWAKTNADLRRERGEKRSRLPLYVALSTVVGLGLFFGVRAMQASVPQAMDGSPVEAVSTSKYVSPTELMTVNPQTLRETVRLTGTLAPVVKEQVPALVSAPLMSVSVQVGDSVSRDTRLVRMDTTTLQLQKEQQVSSIEATEANLELAESQLRRTEDLVAKGISPASQLEQQQSSVKAMQANLKAQQGQLKLIEQQLLDARVVSPISGEVSARYVDSGQFVAAGSPMFEIVSLSRLELQANLAAAKAPALAKGMAVQVYVDGHDRVFSGQVERISPVVSQGTQSIPVFISLDNSDGALRAGVFASAELTLSQIDDRIGVPTQAVHGGQTEQPFVLVIEDEQVVRRDVRLGSLWQSGQVREIQSGLNAGDVIVRLPLAGLTEGDRIALIGG